MVLGVWSARLTPGIRSGCNKIRSQSHVSSMGSTILGENVTDGCVGLTAKPLLHSQCLDYSRRPAFFILNRQAPLWLQSKRNWKFSRGMAFYTSKNEIHLSLDLSEFCNLSLCVASVAHSSSFFLLVYLIILQIYSRGSLITSENSYASDMNNVLFHNQSLIHCLHRNDL